MILLSFIQKKRNNLNRLVFFFHYSESCQRVQHSNRLSMLMENQIKHSNIKLKLLILLGFDFLFALNKHDVLYEAKTHKCACECSECIPNMVIIFISSSWRFSAIYLVFTLDCMLSFAPYVNRIPKMHGI